ncbi:MAG: hypothetical protein HYR85_27565 [Planctomycetes bacterium]|nr:hypothetical protein [Planctomycetota bacterium]MBI3844261.1 hypothetical protein [Planctomycetota bacterium]
MKPLAAFLLLGAALPGCVRRSEPALLRVTAPAGRVLRFETQIETEQEGFLGLNVNATSTIAWSLTTTPSDENGIETLALRIGGMGTTLRGLPFGGTENERDVAPPIPESLKDGSIALRLDSRGRLRGIVGIDAWIGKRSASVQDSDAPRTSLMSTLAQGAAAGIVEQAARGIVQVFGLVPLPEEPVTSGATWTDTGTIGVPFFAQVKYDNRIELLGAKPDGAGGSIHEIKEDIALDGQVALPSAPQGGFVQIDRGFAVGDVELDATGLPLAADIRCGLTFSATVSGEATGTAERGVAVTFRAHLVTKRVATVENVR